jgi:hypothetical protein
VAVDVDSMGRLSRGGSVRLVRLKPNTTIVASAFRRTYRTRQAATKYGRRSKRRNPGQESTSRVVHRAVKSWESSLPRSEVADTKRCTRSPFCTSPV